MSRGFILVDICTVKTAAGKMVDGFFVQFSFFKRNTEHEMLKVTGSIPVQF